MSGFVPSPAILDEIWTTTGAYIEPWEGNVSSRQVAPLTAVSRFLDEPSEGGCRYGAPASGRPSSESTFTGSGASLILRIGRGTYSDPIFNPDLATSSRAPGSGRDRTASLPTSILASAQSRHSVVRDHFPRNLAISTEKDHKLGSSSRPSGNQASGGKDSTQLGEEYAGRRVCPGARGGGHRVEGQAVRLTFHLGPVSP